MKPFSLREKKQKFFASSGINWNVLGSNPGEGIDQRTWIILLYFNLVAPLSDTAESELSWNDQLLHFKVTRTKSWLPRSHHVNDDLHKNLQFAVIFTSFELEPWAWSQSTNIVTFSKFLKSLE